MPTTLLEMGKILGILSQMFPSYKTQSPTDRASRIKAYHLVLGDIEAAGLMQAAIKVGGTGTFFPSAGDLRRAYFDQIDIAAGVPSATDAWGEVKALFRRGYSRVRPPTEQSVSHPRILKAIESVGGWYALCMSTNDMSDRARYIQAYETLDRRERENERLQPGVREIFRQLADKMSMDRLGPGRDIEEE